MRRNRPSTFFLASDFNNAPLARGYLVEYFAILQFNGDDTVTETRFSGLFELPFFG